MKMVTKLAVKNLETLAVRREGCLASSSISAALRDGGLADRGLGILSAILSFGGISTRVDENDPSCVAECIRFDIVSREKFYYNPSRVRDVYVLLDQILEIENEYKQGIEVDPSISKGHLEQGESKKSWEGNATEEVCDKRIQQERMSKASSEAKAETIEGKL
ncbi:NAD(P)-binding Rossmann-fold superfamily protein [Striga asiatica]|uniref:NAD(P)-binding Rossmann-fold superfamily protein n=1 Tax=Striga asiatica TaxID=4170 RepID=A0A5A7PYD6_STRAF|nr:NAD(P)-binding Rossmann-fold superfamily protein [Striga asiatica]